MVGYAPEMSSKLSEKESAGQVCSKHCNVYFVAVAI